MESDIERLVKLCAHLNPYAEEIGAGMLREINNIAIRVLAEKPEPNELEG